MHVHLRIAVPLWLLALSTTGFLGCGSADDTSHQGGSGGESGTCSVGEIRCAGQIPLTCNAEGAWVAGEACEFACVEGDCTGECVAGSERCDGLVPQRCNAEGAWVTGEACQFACSGGACAGGCAAGSERCDGLVPQRCDSEGAWVAGEACEYACSAGACIGACVPGSTQCDGLIPETCNAEGVWVAGDACEYACSAGACIGACVPGSTQCDGLIPETCNAEGAWVAGDACEFVCTEGGCTGECVPGTGRCEDLIPETCSAEGAWVAGDACEFVCAEGDCAGECVPGTGRCEDQIPETCSAEGAWVAGDACEFLCTAGICTGECAPGDQRCRDASTVETCDATGSWAATTCPYSCSARLNQCACDPGYVGDGFACTPIDFCNALNGGCSPQATCSQVGATPTCSCNPGFYGDGFSCTVPVTLIDEGFDDISQLPARGWSFENLSAPPGIVSWFQGNNVSNGGPFDAFDGNANGYIGVNFNSTAGSGTISNWLVSEPVNFGGQAALSFYTRAADGPTRYADRIEVRACPQLPCALPEDSGSVGDYSILLGAVNPTLVSNGYPSAWTRFEYTNAAGIPWSGSGRFAIRYFVTNGGPTGANSDYIGIDRLVMSAGAPAYAVGGVVSGLNAGTVVLWLNGSELLTVTGDGAFSFSHRLDSGTPWSVRVHQQPPGHFCTITTYAGTIAAADEGSVHVACVPESPVR
ncbi:choice-of-anchor J domain-containing protein [Vulgatibacter incomptus]|uniref:EGF-like domain-containing protein n=1 Tax=Vulgatibacter incomptus TaxID=1391653 RepID=A0A0K1PH05_9BACT|nr:choice-of-anchor J domain-containing protein [Vulgatibacter incomptus]AKU92701.1 hypothetical protein AKJ08_3088 [Vulgatibacter incomptus]